MPHAVFLSYSAPYSLETLTRIVRETRERAEAAGERPAPEADTIFRPGLPAKHWRQQTFMARLANTFSRGTGNADAA